MNTYQKVAIYAIVIGLIGWGLFFWTRFESGKKDETYHRDREQNLAASAHHASEAKKYQAVADSLLKDLTAVKQSEDERAEQSRKTIVVLNARINSLKASRKIEPDDTTKAIEQAYDSTITAQDAEIKTLTAEKENQWVKFNQILNTSDSAKVELQQAIDRLTLVTESDGKKIAEQGKKIGRLEKIATALGISTATLAVVVTIMALL